MREIHGIRSSWLWRERWASSTSHGSLSRTCYKLFDKTRQSIATKPLKPWWTIAVIRRILSDISFSTFAGIGIAERQALSDNTCTALQLANFWQDVSVDYAKGRIYLPLEDLRRYQVSEQDVAGGRNTPAFCDLMRFEVQRTREWFGRGWPLSAQVDRELAVDLELFSRGGQEILNAIERQGCGVLGRRPAISKTRKLALVVRAALGKLL